MVFRMVILPPIHPDPGKSFAKNVSIFPNHFEKCARARSCHMGKTNPKVVARLRRKKRFLKKIRGTQERPRLCVYRSNKHIFAQIIDDERSTTLTSASTLSKEISGSLPKTGTVAAAKTVGELLARKAKERNIQKLVFDRNGFIYHGRVKALAEAVREVGLDF
jgi:large subunit ribosomal protein L18